MKPEEYAAYDALGLANLIRQRDISRVEAVDAAAEIAERRNPEINAICYQAYEQARATAAERDAKNSSGNLFDGVPYLLKDLFGEIEGWPERRGSKILAENKSAYTDSLTARQLEAGLIPIGKTTTPEFGLIGVTESDAYGDTRNPWNLDHTPGASSGGSAAAVAAGIAPMAHANDGGGSIRIPASFSGCFGLKPSFGRVPNEGSRWVMGDTSVRGPLCRSVADAALHLDAVVGAHPLDPNSLPHPGIAHHR